MSHTCGWRNDIRAEPQDQQKLIALQRVDTEIARLQHRRANLPEHARIAEGLAKRKTLMGEFTEAQTQVSDLQRELAKAEADLEPVKARRIRNQERIDSGAVADPKALTGLVDEVAHLGKRISDLEDAELEVMESLEAATARFEHITTERTTMEQSIREQMAKRDSQSAEIDAQLTEAGTDREAIVATLPAPLVKYYERIRDHHAGLGVAVLSQGACTGCRLDLTAADLRDLAAAPADELPLCEECGRILVRTEDSGLPKT